MKRVWPTLCVTLLLFAVGLSAQNPPPMPKPGPELKRLAYFVGDWISEGTIQPGPMGPGGKFTSKDHYEWMKGGFFLVSRGTYEGAMGSGTGLGVMGYNTEEKAYTYDGFDSTGMADHAKGNISGDTWTFTNEEKMGGQVMRGRYSMKVTSPTSYTFKFEMAPANGSWSTVMEGTATKAAKAAAPAAAKKPPTKKSN